MVKEVKHMYIQLICIELCYPIVFYSRTVRILNLRSALVTKLLLMFLSLSLFLSLSHQRNKTALCIVERKLATCGYIPSLI